MTHLLKNYFKNKALERFFNSLKTHLALTLACLSLTACITFVPTSATMGILKMALTAPLIDLETRANKGEARSQYALGIIYTYGLRGKSKNAYLAGSLKQKAVAQRGTLPITQYIHGINGAPSRTHIINVAHYDLTSFEADAVDSCASFLAKKQNDEEAVKACGGQDSLNTLQALWDTAKKEVSLPSQKIRF